MKENQAAPMERMKVLVDLLNIKVAFPKFTTQNVKGKVEQIPNGNYEVTPFTDEEIMMLKALIFMDIQDHVDCGRLTEMQNKRRSEQDRLAEVIKKAGLADSTLPEVEHQVIQG